MKMAINYGKEFLPLPRRSVSSLTQPLDTIMPPKSAPSKKAEQKAKDKIIEDKTFGLKNKNKSAKVNQYIKQLEATVKGGNSKKAKVKDSGPVQYIIDV